jgi:hypothetical protein
MMIKLTNTSQPFTGDSIYINMNCITSVYRVPTDGGSLVTCVHCRDAAGSITWEVEQSPEYIAKLIEEAHAKSNRCSCN